jgi:hypothetical protein
MEKLIASKGDEIEPAEERRRAVPVQAVLRPGDHEGGRSRLRARRAVKADEDVEGIPDHDGENRLPDIEADEDHQPAEDDVDEGRVGREPNPEQLTGSSMTLRVGNDVDSPNLDVSGAIRLRLVERACLRCVRLSGHPDSFPAR